jgi:IS4 transposase
MHDELQQPSIRYAVGADRRDVDLFLSAFADGAVLRVFDPATADTPVSTRDTPERLANIIERLRAYEATFHLLGQSAFDEQANTGEVYCVARHLDRTNNTDFVMYIRYRDRYAQDEGGWRIAERDVLVDWTETRRVVDPRTGE